MPSPSTPSTTRMLMNQHYHTPIVTFVTGTGAIHLHQHFVQTHIRHLPCAFTTLHTTILEYTSPHVPRHLATTNGQIQAMQCSPPCHYQGTKLARHNHTRSYFPFSARVPFLLKSQMAISYSISWHFPRVHIIPTSFALPRHNNPAPFPTMGNIGI